MVESGCNASDGVSRTSYIAKYSPNSSVDVGRIVPDSSINRAISPDAKGNIGTCTPVSLVEEIDSMNNNGTSLI